MNKEWYKSKTVGTAIATGALGVAAAVGYVVPEWIYTILVAFGLYSVRDAIKQLLIVIRSNGGLATGPHYLEGFIKW